MSKKKAKKQGKRSTRIELVGAPLAQSGKFRQVTFDCTFHKSKSFTPKTHRKDSAKGLYEYVKPKFGKIVKEKRFNVFDNQ